MSRFQVEVVPIVLKPHPNADTLSIAEIYGYTCVVRTKDFEGVSAGAYIPPDSLVPADRPEFAFLKDKAKHDGKARIKVVRLRGVVSQGLLLPGKPGWEIGGDVAAELGVVHYDPPLPLSTSGEDEEAPPGQRPAYDVEHWRRYREILSPGEPVLVTEKVHGTSARYCFVEDRLRAGSRSTWKKKDEKSAWWRAAGAHPEVEAFCRANPDLTVYAEVYGHVQDLKYGTKPGEVRIAVFDLLRGNRYLAAKDARGIGAPLPWVPTIYEGPYDPAKVEALAEGPSLVKGANHVREGIVIRPLEDRFHPELGRVQLKIVGNGYLERA